MTFIQIALFDWLPGHMNGKSSKNIKKMFFSETIRGMKLKLGIHT